MQPGINRSLDQSNARPPTVVPRSRPPRCTCPDQAQNRRVAAFPKTRSLSLHPRPTTASHAASYAGMVKHSGQRARTAATKRRQRTTWNLGAEVCEEIELVQRRGRHNRGFTPYLNLEHEYATPEPVAAASASRELSQVKIKAEQSDEGTASEYDSDNPQPSRFQREVQEQETLRASLIHPKIVFPDHITGKTPAAYEWVPVEKENKKKQQWKQKWKQQRERRRRKGNQKLNIASSEISVNKRVKFEDDIEPDPELRDLQETSNKRVKLGHDIKPDLKPRVLQETTKEFLIDPMTSPSRIMRGWSDEAIAAVWKHSCKNGQIKSAPEAHKFQLRRHSETPDEDREMAAEDRESCLNIVEQTSSVAYKASTIGWHRPSKRIEMADKDMMYLLVRTGDGNPIAFTQRGLFTDIVAFISFKIDYDDPPNEHRQVVYIYEVHIAEEFRGQGLGRWLMFTVEAMAQSVTISKTMLTVFRSNDGAIKAYEKMGYTKDQCSPPDRIVRRRVIESDYMIMSKMWEPFSGEIIRL